MTRRRRCVLRPRPGDDQRDSGSSTVEFVIASVVMVTLLLVIVQVAMYFHMRSVAHTAARQGLDQVRVVDGTTASGIATASEFLSQAGNGLDDQRVTADRSDEYATVTVSGSVVSIIPGLSLHVEETVEAPVERVTP